MKNELKKKFDQAEFLNKKSDELKINIENWNLQDISQENISSSSLRVIKDNKIGSNTTLGESDKVIDKLIEGAEESVQYGGESKINFSSENMKNFAPVEKKDYESVDSEQIFSFIEEFFEYVKSKKEDITFDLKLNKKLDKIKIETTNGGILEEEIVNFSLNFGAPIPGGGSVLYRVLEQPEFFSKLPREEIDDFLEEYEKTYEVSTPDTGKMPVLFSPRALYFLFVSLQAGVSGRTIYRETSPLLDKIDEKIFSDKLTIIDMPNMKKSGSRRSFDDEGIPTSEKKIISQGVLKNYIYDLEYAAKLDEKPSGNGLKKELFGGDINTPVSPNFINPVIEPGEKSKKELISKIEEGIFVTHVIGFHSSNYEQGHFSVQAQGFHVKNGKLQGRLQDVMMAGNIYEDFYNIRGLGNAIYPNMKGYAPYILVDDVSVTGK